MSSAESWPKLQGADSARRESPKQQRLFAEIYRVVARIPRGRVATYGQIATYLERCTPRQVGYALARADDTVDIPWHRVINHRGEVSLSGTSGE
ncbi:MAG: MGMT family protein [Gammaproteobacteria bacterium]|nr:MGMT family protein [Gammaproteobacteria bacterium]